MPQYTIKVCIIPAHQPVAFGSEDEDVFILYKKIQYFESTSFSATGQIAQCFPDNQTDIVLSSSGS